MFCMPKNGISSVEMLHFLPCLILNSIQVDYQQLQSCKIKLPHPQELPLPPLLELPPSMPH